MNSALFTMSTLINKKSYVHILYNTKCLFYEIITSHFARNHNLQCMKIRPCTITEFDEPSNSSVNEVVVVQIDIDRHQKSRTFFYIVSKLAFYNFILDLSWMKQNKIILNADRVFLTIEFTETIIWNRKASAESEFNYVIMLATFFMNLVQKKEEKQKKIEMFSVSVRVNNWAQSHSHMLLSILSENSYKESFFTPESFSEISLDINKDRWSCFIIK